MLWNKQDPSVSEEAIRAIGWIVVRTPDGDKICPERALLSTAHLSFWDVKWAVTERGPALVCGDTTLGYLNDERYVPQAVRATSQGAEEPHPYPCIVDIRSTTEEDPCVKCPGGEKCGGGGPQRMHAYLKTIKENPCRKCDHVLICDLKHICTAKRAFFKNLNGCKHPLTLHIPRAHNVVRMLRELGGDTRDGPMGVRPDPITSAMRLVKDMALRNEETLASFKTWADRVLATFALIQAVEQAMKSIGTEQVFLEGVEYEIRKSLFAGTGVQFSVYRRGLSHTFKTAQEAAGIIQQMLEAERKRPAPAKYGDTLRENIIQVRAMEHVNSTKCECGKILHIDLEGHMVQVVKCACGRETEVSF